MLTTLANIHAATTCIALGLMVPLYFFGPWATLAIIGVAGVGAATGMIIAIVRDTRDDD